MRKGYFNEFVIKLKNRLETCDVYASYFENKSSSFRAISILNLNLNGYSS